MSDRVFASVDEAMEAKRRGILLYARVGGVAARATEAHISHPVPGIGTAVIYLPKPVPAELQLNATLEIEIGHPGTIRRRFYGFIPRYSRAISDRGYAIRVQAVGWLSYLNYPDADGTSIDGPISLKDVFRSLMLARSVPASRSDNTVYVDGVTPIMLGGNAAVDGGDVRFTGDTSPHTYLQQVTELFGYAVHDTPDGEPHQSHVGGIPIPEHTVGGLEYLYAAGDYATPRTNINVRTGAGTSNPVIGGINDGDLFRIEEGPVINDSGSTGNHWYRVRALNGPSGWAGMLNSSHVPNAYAVDLLEPLYWFDEGVNLRSLDWSTDRTGIVTFVEVVGKSYTELDGGKNEIRSIPAEVEANDYVAPQTYIHKKFTSQWLVTDEQAKGSRNAYEVDLSAPIESFTWTAAGREDIQPAEIAVLTSHTYGLSNRTVRIMQLNDDVTDSQGYEQSFRGEYGGGQALRAGNDCVRKTIGAGPYHVGNQTLSWYADPTPNSSDNNEDEEMRIVIPFTIEDVDYSSVRVEGEAHGTNTYNNKTASTGSKIEIWQKEDPSLPTSADNELRRVGSVELPTLHEEASKRRPYGTQAKWWTKFSLPINGRLKVGAAEMRLVAGENVDGWDDYEVRNLSLWTCGVGMPILPGSGA